MQLKSCAIVKIAAGVARLVKTKQIVASARAKARQAPSKLAAEWSGDDIRLRADDRAGRHDLRAADALQLGLPLSSGVASGLMAKFSVYRSPIRNAAVAEGFANHQHYLPSSFFACATTFSVVKPQCW